MSDSAQLLRMLEPAVRPVGVAPGASPKPATAPFEQRSFESLLSEARSHASSGVDPAARAARASRPDAAAGSAVAEATNQTDVLGPLNGLGTVENATLRQIMARHANADASSGA